VGVRSSKGRGYCRIDQIDKTVLEGLGGAGENDWSGSPVEGQKGTAKLT